MALPHAEELDLRAVIGFAGHVPRGLILHPDQKRLIYPLGCTIVAKQLLKHEQEFLTAHEYPVSCLCMNREGTLLASGEECHMGFKARIIVWDLTTMTMQQELILHKGKVQSLCFSPNSKFLASLGEDSKLILWDLANGGKPVCGSDASTEPVNVVKFYNNSNEMLVTAGKYNIRTWKVDLPNRKLRPNDCKLGQIKRVINCLCIDREDKFIYAGTQSGDVICINAQSHMFQGIGPRKRPFSCGVREMEWADDEHFIVATGTGTVALMNAQRLVVKRRTKLDGKVTSIQFNAEKDHFFVGTNLSNIYCVCLEDFEFELRTSAHYKPVHCVAFPPSFSELFVTASNDIRVWHRKTLNELLRIQIPNIECKCVCVSSDGKQIISGWSDGKIRANMPQTGRLIYAINDAHRGCVNSVKITKDGTKLVSAGDDGQVRVWSASIESQALIMSWKEHTGAVTHLELSADDSTLLSSSVDGSCIVWDLKSYHRQNALFASNQFMHILYHPDQSQLLTTGADRKISWWCACDMEPIRVLDGSDKASIETLAIMQNGEQFVSAGGDMLVKLWNYDEGVVTKVGTGHSGSIQGVAISPDNQNIVSVGKENGIFIWNLS